MQNKKYNILQVNNIDLLGKRFSGFDIQDYLNKETSEFTRFSSSSGKAI